MNPLPLATDEDDRQDDMPRMIRVLTKILKVRPEEIRAESRLTIDLHADSLDLAEIAAELEDEFQVKVEEADVYRITTVGEAIDYVRRLQPNP